VNTWKAIFAALVIFGAGLVTGAVWTRVSSDAKPLPGGAAVKPAGPRPQNTLRLEHLHKVELMGRVQKELDLTPEQRERIEEVISDGQGRIRDLWDQVAPEIHDELKHVREKLCSELTPDQKQRFDELMKQPRRSSSTNSPPKAIEP
jgi:Spy/CpxP family protein refolding chaperone